MNFDIGEVLTRAWRITWNHRVLWVFKMFPLLFNLLFIPMFFIGPNSLFNQEFVDQSLYISLFLTANILLTALSVLLYASGSASSWLGILRVENGREQLPFRDLFQDGLDYFWRTLGVAKAISRCWTLFQANFWRILLVALVIYFGMFMLSSVVALPFMVPFFFLPILIERSQDGFNFQRIGWILLGLSLILLPVLALVQGFSMKFLRSSFMIIYLRLTRSTVLQTALQ